MIADSVPWREELYKSALRLQRWNTQSRWTSRTYFLAERDIMMGAYAIRRLIDSGKCSSNLPTRRCQMHWYQLTGRAPRGWRDRFSPEDFYDLFSPRNGELTAARLCNEIIHSYVFQIFGEEDDTTAVALVSDYDRSKRLWSISFDGLAELFDYVAREDVLESHVHTTSEIDEVHRVSNHDLVESGRAIYSDESHTYVDRLDAD